MKITAFVLAAIVLSGCASLASEGTQAMQNGNYAEAERMLQQAIRDGDTSAWNNLGVVYERTGRTDLAIRAYQMAARYGNPTAQQNLVMKRLPVPPADLAEKPDNSPYIDWFPGTRGARVPTYCDSTPGRGGNVSMTCN